MANKYPVVLTNDIFEELQSGDTLTGDLDATKIKGVTVDDTDIATDKALVYNGSELEYRTIIGGGTGSGYSFSDLDIDFSYVYSQAGGDTTSTSFVTINGTLDYTTPSLAGGLYRISCCYRVATSAANRTASIRIYVDNTPPELQESSVRPTASNIYLGASFFGYINLSSGTHNIKVQHKVSSNTVYSRDIYLEIWRVE